MKTCREIVIACVFLLSFFPAYASGASGKNSRLLRHYSDKKAPVVAGGEPVAQTDSIGPQNDQQMRSLREENLVKGGQVSKHYLDLNPDVSSQGYDWDKTTDAMGGDQFSYQHTPYGVKNSGPKRDGIGLHLEPLYYNPDDRHGGIFNKSARHYKWSYGKWRPLLKENLG